MTTFSLIMLMNIFPAFIMVGLTLIIWYYGRFVGRS